MLSTHVPNPRRQASRLHRSIVGLLLACLLLTMCLAAWGQTAHAQALPGAPLADRVLQEQATPTPTLLPEIAANRYQTNGLVVGGILLVLIIVIGTLWTLRRRPHI